MKNTFFEFYKLDNETFKNIWERGLIVIDANILLNFYRYKEETKRQLFTILDKSKERIWLPHQVALEYHRNRITVIKDQIKAYDDIIKQIREKTESLTCLNEYKRHPFIDTESIKKIISDFNSDLYKKLEEQRIKHPNYLDDDIILSGITLLYDGKVGNEYEEDKLQIIFKEGKTRYESKTPPGYCDLKSKKDIPSSQLYGDLILWKQIIDKAKSSKRDIVFVTDDMKDDWWEKEEGKTIGPRKELIREFRIKTDCNILIYKTDLFLREAVNHIDVSISDESITDVVEIRENNVNFQIKRNKLRYKSLIESFDNELLNKQLSETINMEVKNYDNQLSYKAILDLKNKINLLTNNFENEKFRNRNDELIRIINKFNMSNNNDDIDDDVELVPQE